MNYSIMFLCLALSVSCAKKSISRLESVDSSPRMRNPYFGGHADHMDAESMKRKKEREEKARTKRIEEMRQRKIKEAVGYLPGGKVQKSVLESYLAPYGSEDSVENLKTRLVAVKLRSIKGFNLSLSKIEGQAKNAIKAHNRHIEEGLKTFPFVEDLINKPLETEYLSDENSELGQKVRFISGKLLVSGGDHEITKQANATLKIADKYIGQGNTKAAMLSLNVSEGLSIVASNKELANSAPLTLSSIDLSSHGLEAKKLSYKIALECVRSAIALNQKGNNQSANDYFSYSEILLNIAIGVENIEGLSKIPANIISENSGYTINFENLNQIIAKR